MKKINKEIKELILNTNEGSYIECLKARINYSAFKSKEFTLLSYQEFENVMIIVIPIEKKPSCDNCIKNWKECEIRNPQYNFCDKFKPKE